MCEEHIVQFKKIQKETKLKRMGTRVEDKRGGVMGMAVIEDLASMKKKS